MKLVLWCNEKDNDNQSQFPIKEKQSQLPVLLVVPNHPVVDHLIWLRRTWAEEEEIWIFAMIIYIVHHGLSKFKSLFGSDPLQRKVAQFEFVSTFNAYSFDWSIVMLDL